MKISAFLSSVFAVLIFTSCSSDQGPTQPEAVSSATKNPAVVHATEGHAAMPADQKEQIPPSMTKDGLPKELVCMVNNMYMGKKQFPVEFADKMYYGCCEMCVKTIKNESQVREALDPVTGKKVDKSSAFIALKKGSTNGDVEYFESEQNYKKYLAQTL